MRKSWLRRLPLLIVVAVGVWLWRAGAFPQEREIVWQLGPSASAHELEIQILDEQGALLAREQLFFHKSAPRDVIQKVRLADGAYRARLFIRRGPADREEQHTLSLRLQGPDTVVATVPEEPAAQAR